MNLNEPMAEPHGNFVRRICVVFNPISRVVDGVLHVWANSVRFDADIAVGRPVLPGPTPYVAEHSPMQLAQKLPIKDITLARLGPALSVADIGLLIKAEEKRFLFGHTLSLRHQAAKGTRSEASKSWRV